jgi:hypothetical protein
MAHLAQSGYSLPGQNWAYPRVAWWSDVISEIPALPTLIVVEPTLNTLWEGLQLIDTCVSRQLRKGRGMLRAPYEFLRFGSSAPFRPGCCVYNCNVVVSPVSGMVQRASFFPGRTLRSM